jgi:DNA processing protein
LTDGAGESSRREACEGCLRRGWLLARLSPLLDRCAPDRDRLFSLLELEDEELIEALAGSRRASTHAAYAACDPTRRSREEGVRTSCRHSELYPRSLRAAGTPHLLHVAGPLERLRELTDAPTVALLGCERASDYGLEMAAAIARELSACAITVVSCARKGIGAAAQTGALEAGSRCVALFGDGLARAAQRPGCALLSHVAAGGCAVSELPAEVSGRVWGRAASERLAVELAQLVLLVEGEASVGELAGAHMALARGTPVGAVPGRANSALSGAPHTLLRGGASLVGGAEDALELLYPLAGGAREAAPGVMLEPALRRVLEAVGAGRDSAEALGRQLERPLPEILFALTQLELMGLLAKGRGGRYLRRLGPPLGAPGTDQ